MNKPDLDDIPPFPPEWETTPEQEMAICIERLAKVQATGMAVPLEDVIAWLEARRTDPTAPRPQPRKLF